MRNSTKFIVCGLGKSVNQFTKKPGWKALKRDYTVIGVNDIERLFTPHYLVVMDEEKGIPADRYHYIYNSMAVKVFSPHRLRLRRCSLKHLHLGDAIYLGEEIKQPYLDDYRTFSQFFDYAMDSCFMACQVAYSLGAKEINLIGVDFGVGHFWEKGGKLHQLGTELELPRVNLVYAVLWRTLVLHGCYLFNCSINSNLKSIPFREL